MAKRPAGVHRETWRAERRQVWRTRNLILNLLMILAIALVLARWAFS